MEIDIIGGIYYEKCISPVWHDIYGSGLRSAISLSNSTQKIRLHSLIDQASRKHISLLNSSFSNIEFSLEPVKSNLSFFYYHPLSVPEIAPHPLSIDNKPLIKVKASKVIQFGMFDADVKLYGDQVVYDLQSIWNPKSFKLFGSEAKELIIIGNTSEIRKLGKSSDLIEAAKNICRAESADFVIVKRGPYGGMVISKDKETFFTAYKSSKVFPIGSGDIFTTVFSYYWFNGAAPLEAAQKASKATSFYVENVYLPLDLNAIENAACEELRAKETTKQIYLAGPFFNDYERWIIEESFRYLSSMPIKVFSPIHNVGRGKAEEVVKKDIEGLNNSNLLFGIVDNLDSGTIFEIGYAVAKDIPVIAFSQKESKEDLKMLYGTNCQIYNDYSTAIYNAIWKTLEL